MRNKKHAKGLLLLVFVFFISTVICPAVISFADGEAYGPYYACKSEETGRYAVIDDAADLLTDVEEAKLAEKMQPITAYGNVGFVTVDYTGYSTESYVDSWGQFYLGTESSTAFIIDMDNREIRLWANNGGKDTIGGIITVSYQNTITDNVYTYASDEDYYSCAAKAFEQVLAVLEGRKIAQPMKYICNALMALAFGMLTCYVIARMTSQAKRTTDKEMLTYVEKNVNYSEPKLTFHYTEKKYHPRSSGGGGRSGGGGGGGGHSGGHGF